MDAIRRRPACIARLARRRMALAARIGAAAARAATALLAAAFGRPLRLGVHPPGLLGHLLVLLASVGLMG